MATLAAAFAVGLVPAASHAEPFGLVTDSPDHPVATVAPVALKGKSDGKAGSLSDKSCQRIANNVARQTEKAVDAANNGDFNGFKQWDDRSTRNLETGQKAGCVFSP